MPSNDLSNRRIRVFISSTFQDMQGERTYLMRRAFPRLRKIAEKNDVVITEVDLRWGIQEEEVKNGKVVEICFREIENSIPFFVGIVGNRYGWVPKKSELNDHVIERYHNVESYLERHLSVTEMEIQFGVLQREEKMHAYFYIKKEDSNKEFSSEPDNDYEMLERLKHEIKNSGYPYQIYSSPQDLAEYVERAFKTLLETLFPDGNVSELEKERIGQRSFLNQMCQNYVPDENNFKILDEWMNDWELHNMVITGESGLGKSALIANWIQRKIADKNRKYEIIYHFTGNGGSESSYEFIRKVLKDEIIDIYNFDQSEDSQELTLANLFIKIAKEQSRPLLIVLDAINQIYDVDNAKLLNWLPTPPKNVKILFSTLEEDRTMDVFKNRSYPLFVLMPLNAEKKQELVVRYLKDFGKTLTYDQVSQIITSPICENTLVLRTLLDELINYGIYEKLGNRITYFSSQPSIDDFYHALLRSYEEEFGEDLVKHILSLIAISKNGLSEEEIIEISQTKPLYWSQFFCSFTRNLTTKAGLISFSHTYIMQAVVNRYTKTEKWNTTCRKEIIAFFNKSTKEHRNWEELSFQYYSLNENESLFQLIRKIPVFASLYNKNRYELATYWRQLINAGYNINTYLETIEEVPEKTNYYKKLIAFSRDVLGKYEQASSFCDSFNAYIQTIKVDYHTIVDFYNQYGLLCNKIGNKKQAIGQYNKAIKILEELGKEEERKDRLKKAQLYNNIGLVYKEIAEYEQAIKYLQDALDIRTKEVGKKNIITGIYINNIGLVYRSIGKYDKALNCYNKTLEIFMAKYGYSDSRVATLYNNIGAVYKSKGDFGQALFNSQKALEIQQELLGEQHPDTAVTHDTIGDILFSLSKYRESKEHYIEALKIREVSFGIKDSRTANSYKHVGSIYQRLGELETACTYYKQALHILQEIWGDDHLLTASSYNSIGQIYYLKKDYQTALQYYKKALIIRKKTLGINSRGTASSLNIVGLAYYRLKDFEKAFKNIGKAREIYEGLLGKEHPTTATSYNNLGLLYSSIGNYEEALTYYNMALNIRKEKQGENHISTALLYFNIGRVYFKTWKYKLAYDYCNKSLEIRKSILPPRHPDIAKSEKLIIKLKTLI